MEIGRRNKIWNTAKQHDRNSVLRWRASQHDKERRTPNLMNIMKTVQKEFIWLKRRTPNYWITWTRSRNTSLDWKDELRTSVIILESGTTDLIWLKRRTPNCCITWKCSRKNYLYHQRLILTINGFSQSVVERVYLNKNTNLKLLDNMKAWQKRTPNIFFLITTIVLSLLVRIQKQGDGSLKLCST